MIKVIIPKHDSSELNTSIVKFVDRLVNETIKTGSKPNIIVFATPSEHLHAYELSLMFESFSPNDIYFIHPRLMAQNLHEFDVYPYRNNLIAVLPYKKPVNEPTNNYIPINLQSAIHNNYMICYIDESAPKNNDYTLVLDANNVIYSKDKLTEKILKINERQQ